MLGLLQNSTAVEFRRMTESDTIVQNQKENIPSDDPIPVEPLLVLNGTLNSLPVQLLKDDGCNTNIVSKRLVNRNRYFFRLAKKSCVIQHSKEYANEITTDMILNGTVKIESHTFRTNWLVPDCRYDVLLGMPWHVKFKPTVDYEKRIVKGNSAGKSVKASEMKDQNAASVKVASMIVKMVRQMLTREPSSRFQVFKVLTKHPIKYRMKSRNPDLRMNRLMKKFQSVFQSELPDGLPQKWFVDHAVEVEDGSKPPHRRLYQFSPAEQKAANEYIEDLLKKEKIRRSESPYGATLFFMKEKIS